MTTPFYISPEQIMKDKADYARKGIARGRSAVVLQYDAGILLVAENWSPALHKISEIYDQIAFAAVGRYNEFENLRIMGVRIADLRGYSYDRRDVTARGLANAYAQTLGTIFSSAGEKPFEVELVVAEVGDTAADDQIYRLTYDGSVADEHGWMVMGGQTEPIAAYLEQNYAEGLGVDDAIRLAVRALGEGNPGTDGPRRIEANQLEVAVLDRGRPTRKFKRLTRARLETVLGTDAPAAAPAAPAPAGDAAPAGDGAERPATGPQPPKPGETSTGDGDGGPAL
ncbi:proteasome subunit alpha [Sporichthya brevicatena]|uniref:Proteasome subunit alpha n=1 Tax=Sporichthya brevicatena TaxID=171442 RepID=A0ABN1GXJ7_9ACTN